MIENNKSSAAAKPNVSRRTNTIALKSVSQLLGEKFYIPSYQRGYRWTKQQVEDLLSDIYSFAIKKKMPMEFYCLQPIIVKYIQEEDHYEVVDGQQRLTTIRIIMSYIIDHDYQGKSFEKEHGTPMFSIDFQTRPKTQQFLTNIKEDNDDNVDFLHISNAYKTIREWFEAQKRPKTAKDFILNALTLDNQEDGSTGAVMVIWYEINDENTNPVDTFIRINLGKIPLTNAELIKALFLQQGHLGEGENARLKQLEIAQQWDQIENKLQDQQFWWFLNKSDNRTSSHIEFIFDMMKDLAIQNDPVLAKKVGDDAFATFRYFNILFSNGNTLEVVKSNWANVKEYFDFFVECFENPIWYHYIGFLIYCGMPIKEIYDLMYHESNHSKDDVTLKLINQIKNRVFHTIKWKRKEDDLNVSDWYIELGYTSDRELLRRVFLLFNLQYIVNKSIFGNLVYKFPFRSFKADKKGHNLISWDIEHIDSLKENTLLRVDEQITWLQNAKQDVHLLSGDLVLSIEVDEFIVNPKGKYFQSIYEKIRNLSGEDSISDEMKNDLGNLTLLDAGTNRGYGNALFTTKRRKIIERDKDGVFVPICTKNVFFKYFDGNSRSTWTEDDIYSYRKTIEETLKDFFPFKPEVNAKV